MTYMNGSEKSSRSKADYFEVLIADKLAKHYKVGKNFQREVAELEEEIALAFVDSEYRIFEQKGMTCPQKGYHISQISPSLR